MMLVAKKEFRYEDFVVLKRVFPTRSVGDGAVVDSLPPGLCLQMYQIRPIIGNKH